MLFDARTCAPMTLFNEFMREAAVCGRHDIRKWTSTQKAICDDGAQFATYLHFQGKSLSDANFQDIRNYSALLGTSISSQTGRPLADQTRSRRIGTIIAFYEYAYEKGELPRIIPARNGAVLTGYTFKGGKPKADKAVQILMPHRPDASETVKLIPISVLKQAFEWLGPKVENWQPGGRTSRDRLICESGISTGGRLSSLMSIKIDDVLNAERMIDASDNRQLFTIPVLMKGRASPSILVTQALLKKWIIYMRGERSEVVRACVNRLGRNCAISSKLFLNHANSNDRDLGRAASGDSVSRAFTKAMLAIGNIRYEQRAVRDSEGLILSDQRGRVLWEGVPVAANTFHHLRHTFVVRAYHLMKREGIQNPWKAISLALGHSLISTTIDIYGKHVAIDESLLHDAIDEALYGLDEGVGL